MSNISLHPHLHTLLTLWAQPDEAARAMSAPVTDAFLDHVFIAEADERARPPVRIVKAGQALSATLGRDLRRQDLLTLFHARDRALLLALLDSVAASKHPCLLQIEALSAGRKPLKVDLALAPLGRTLKGARWLGFYQPVSDALPDSPVEAHAILTIHPPQPDLAHQILHFA